MSATEQLNAKLQELPREQREDTARRWLAELELDAELEAIVADVPREGGAPSPSSEEELEALLRQGVEALERSGAEPFDRNKFMDRFRVRHGLA